MQETDERPRVGAERVFLAQQNDRYSVDDAASFGSVCYLLEDHLHPLALSAAARAMGARLQSEGYRPGADYVALTGHAALVPMLVHAATLQAVRLGADSMLVLVFDAAISRYVVRSLPLDQRR